MIKQTNYKQTEVGKIPETWEVKRLDEMCVLQRGFDLPTTKRVNGIVPVYASNGITGWHDSPKAKAPGVVTGRSGKLGNSFYIDTDYWPLNTTLWVKDFKDSDPYFVYLLLSGLNFEDYNAGSSVPTLNRNHIHSLKIAAPNINEQKQIAKTIKDIDDKIELNRRMNRTLEEMGKALFKRWFVDFEFPNENGKPYKSSGGEMVESELEQIPKGWSVEPVGNYIENFDSQRIPLSSREREKRKGIYRYFGATGVVDYVDSFLFDEVYLLIGEDGTVTKKGGFPYTQYVWGKFWVNNHAHIIKAKPPYSTEFMKLFFDSTIITAYITGAVQPKLNQSNLNSIPFIVPNEKLIGRFVDTTNKLYSLFRANEDEINNLVQVRDSLLPRLMSGRLRV